MQSNHPPTHLVLRGPKESVIIAFHLNIHHCEVQSHELELSRRRLLRVLWTARRSNQSILKEIQPVHSEGDQPWDIFGRNDAKAEAPLLWPPHVKSWLIGKDSDAGRDWGQEERGTTEDEMAGSHHWLDGRESEWTPGDGDGQGGLVCCDSWGRKESDTTERLNWTKNWMIQKSLKI